MALFPYQRLATLFDAVSAEVLPQDELAKCLGVSSRTIRTDIKMLNDILHVYGGKISYERSYGYQLQVENPVLFATIPHQKKQTKTIPRSSKERAQALLILFLTNSQSVKLDNIADQWCVSRSTLQNDMVEVREHLKKHQLYLDKRPGYGMRLMGAEASIRACLSDIFWHIVSSGNQRTISKLKQESLKNIDLTYLEKITQNSFDRFELRLTPEGMRYFIYNCAVSIIRITNGQELLEFTADDVDDVIKKAAEEIAKGFVFFLGNEVSVAEQNYISIQIAARCISDNDPSLVAEKQTNTEALVEYILIYINENYNYNLCNDEKLITDLTTHLNSMIARVKYRISSPNPLLSDIKRYYPFAYDVTLSAMANTEKYLPYEISEDEVGYLAVHIGVALERNYNIGYERHPHALLVSDSGNSTIRVIEAKIKREYPQIQIHRVISLREYEQLSAIDEDFVITTVRLSEKDKPIVKIAPFPTPYQLEQLGRLAMIDRTKPYILDKFFDERFFMLINKPMTQEELFKIVCQKLKDEGFVSDDFYPSLLERESIVSTMLGENIALPHSLGLLAKKTIVATIIAPNGINWGKNEVANVIFLLAICKDEYEEAMAIYDLFVTFLREKATKRLMNSHNFSNFQAIAKDSLGRVG